MPGKMWWYRFMKKWKHELSARKPEHLSTKRAPACSLENLEEFYKRLCVCYEVNGFTSRSYSDFASRLWNCDETGLATACGSKHILARRGAKDVSEVCHASGKGYITTLFCGSAAGEGLAPFILFKAKNINAQWRVGGPPGSLYGCSDSGWMERPHFFDWFKKIFLPQTETLRKSGPVMLFVDGHSSHIALELVVAARANNVILYNLPPNTTHVLQPLDVGVFSSVKAAWRKILKSYSFANEGKGAEKDVFAALVNQLMHDSFQPEHFVSGFRVPGIYPLCEDVHKKATKCQPFQPFSQKEVTVEASATPVTRRIVSYFTDFFKKSATEKANPSLSSD
eukprot:m.259355 g.259355  ORF g.259355 m.259355 type:complete len:338 (+) comp40416_c0_seq13:1120-2133(+)